jgi:TonB family protein
MGHRPPHLIYLALILVFLGRNAAGAQDSRSELAKLFDAAREQSNLRGQSEAAFRLAGDIRIWTDKKHPARGKYLLIWTPATKWKEQIVFKDYSRTRIGEGKQFWQIRSTDYEFPLAFDLDSLLDFRKGLNLQPLDQLSRAPSEKVNDVEAQCVNSVSAVGFARTFCFYISSGALAKYHPSREPPNSALKLGSMEFTQFQVWNGKVFPRTLRGFHGKDLFLEVNFEEIQVAPTLPPDYFSVPKDATVWAYCPGSQRSVVRRVNPFYPESARRKHEQGTVTLYAIIEGDGSVSNLRVVQSAGAELDQAALSAVAQWTYRPSVCGGPAGRQETLIDVIFSLRL